MRKITERVITAFLNGITYRERNTESRNQALYLHGNKIAWWRGNELWISNCGWKSMTTKERLNALPNVSISQKAGKWYLNGMEWNGKPICVNGINDFRIDGDC